MRVRVRERLRCRHESTMGTTVFIRTCSLGQHFYSFGAHVKVSNTGGWGKREELDVRTNETQGNSSALKILHSPGPPWNLCG